MDELLEQFLIETRELVAQASDEFAALARDPRDRAAIESAFRAIHTLKGSFAIFALDPAERVLHAAEDLLERLRKGVDALDPGALAALVACLDQTDRWIDQMGQAGSLSQEAAAIADRLLGDLSAAIGPWRATEPVAADALVKGAAAMVAGSRPPLTAFRYAPDPDCFFRGEDPLALVAMVPQLLSLDIQPVGSAWPATGELEPFTCFCALEGLSAAPLEAVRAAFRLVSQQVSLTTREPGRDADAEALGGGDALAGRTIRVDIARLKGLAEGLGELLVAVHGLSALAAQAETLDRGLAERMRAAQAGLDRISGNLNRSLNAVRSVALEPTLRRLPRMAREIARSLGKDIEFSIQGQSIEVDRQIADGLYEPMLHLLRNAIDHGIETTERRLAAGKPATGRIALTLHRDGDMIDALLADDGAGIDPQVIRRAAVAGGLIAEADALALSDTAALRLIFAAGFSTAPAVTGISGRGVGMNAVQAALEGLRGSIEVDSRIGEGTRFSMRIPANALTTRLLLIEAGGDRYGVALDQVVETVRVDVDRLLPVGDGFACVLRERTVPVLNLARLLGGRERLNDGGKLLVTRVQGAAVALCVDSIGERIDASVQAPTGLLASVPGIMGSALLSDGGILLVLDLPELAA